MRERNRDPRGARDRAGDASHVPGRPRFGVFLRVLLVPLLSWIALETVYPLFAGWIASPDWGRIREGLPSSGAEVPLFVMLASLAAFAWASYSEARWRVFLEPLRAFARWRSPVRVAALAILPVLWGGRLVVEAARGPEEPVARPILHPTPPEGFSSRRNPFRNPTEEQLDAFDAQVRDGTISPETSAEPLVRAYAEAMAAGTASPEARREAFLRHVIEEGRNLVQRNCRPCHGSAVRGTGPLAGAQRRKPLDFTGVETIATLVEGAVFWRVREGGIGLPWEGAPWESAMPPWKEDLSDEEIWKIILAEYDLAGNSPREPESTP